MIFSGASLRRSPDFLVVNGLNAEREIWHRKMSGMSKRALKLF